ncbi:MAG: nuclear transport factor 2 family protein [Fluviicola sp.]
MKRFIIALLCTIFIPMASNAQNETESDYTLIETTVRGFLKAGDQNDAKSIDTFLDDNYRVVMNQLFGSSAVMVISKDVYLSKIESKEWGGDTRKVTIENIQVNGNTASAKVTQVGSKATFISTMILVQHADGQWKLIGDVPTVK